MPFTVRDHDRDCVTPPDLPAVDGCEQNRRPERSPDSPGPKIEGSLVAGDRSPAPNLGPCDGQIDPPSCRPPRLARRRVFTSGLIGGRATPLVHLVPLPMWQERHPRSWPPSVRVSLPPQHFREPSGPTNVRTAAAACGRTAGWCSPFPCGSLATWSCWVRLLRSSTTEPGESSVRRLERPERRRGQRRQNRRPQSRPAPVAPADATTVRCPGESP